MGNACYAGCKLPNFGKDQYKNEECGPGVKCRLSVKCRLQTESKTQAGGKMQDEDC